MTSEEEPADVCCVLNFQRFYSKFNDATHQKHLRIKFVCRNVVTSLWVASATTIPRSRQCSKKLSWTAPETLIASALHPSPLLNRRFIAKNLKGKS